MLHFQTVVDMAKDTEGDLVRNRRDDAERNGQDR